MEKTEGRKQKKYGERRDVERTENYEKGEKIKTTNARKKKERKEYIRKRKVIVKR